MKLEQDSFSLHFLTEQDRRWNSEHNRGERIETYLLKTQTLLCRSQVAVCLSFEHNRSLTNFSQTML